MLRNAEEKGGSEVYSRGLLMPAIRRWDGAKFFGILYTEREQRELRNRVHMEQTATGVHMKIIVLGMRIIARIG